MDSPMNLVDPNDPLAAYSSPRPRASQHACTTAPCQGTKNLSCSCKESDSESSKGSGDDSDAENSSGSRESGGEDSQDEDSDERTTSSTSRNTGGRRKSRIAPEALRRRAGAATDGRRNTPEYHKTNPAPPLPASGKIPWPSGQHGRHGVHYGHLLHMTSGQ
jgi:hypothetical protein